VKITFSIAVRSTRATCFACASGSRAFGICLLRVSPKSSQ
jgi:hypothetical protein